MTKKISAAILIVSGVISLAYNFLLPYPRVNFGLGYFLFVILLLAATVFLEIYHKKKFANKWPWIMVVPILWLAGSVFFFENMFVGFMGIMGSICLLIWMWFWLGVAEFKFSKLQKLFPLSGIVFIGNFFINIVKPFLPLANVKGKVLGKIVIALVIAVPILVVFAAIFASADRIFAEWIRNLIDFNIDAVLVWRFVRTIVFFVIFGGIFYTVLNHERLFERDKPQAIKADEKKGDYLIVNIVIGLVNLLFASFISLQLMFLFGGHEIINRYNITYAEYAQRGFYQMLFASILVVLLSYGLYRLVKSDKLNLTKILTLLLMVQTFVMISSAFKRVLLYINVYNLTEERLLAINMIIFVGLVILALIGVMVLRKHYSVFIKVGFGLAVVYLMFMTGVNMDAQIAKHNIDKHFERQEAGQKDNFDGKYLSRLTADAYSQIVRLKNDDTKVIIYAYYTNERTEVSVYDAWRHYNDEKFVKRARNFSNQRNVSYQRWQSFTVSRLSYFVNR